MNVFNYQKYLKTEKHYAPKSQKPEDIEVFEFASPALKPLNSIKKKAITSIKGVSSPTLFHRALTKMGFGATPETISYIQSLAGATDQDKLNAYIDEQLSPDTIVDTYVDTSLLSGFQTLNKTRMQLYQQHYRRPDEAEIPWEFHILPGRETFYASFLKATQSKKQVFEVMADFWHNHFNVYMDGDGIPPMFVQYDRDVIRANALGNFRQMLEEVTKSTCMLDYLGNAFNEQNAPNENFARELLELHTISAKNYLGHMPWQDVPTDAQGRRVGYVEADVVEMARALTGWSYSGADWWDYQNGNVSTGEFLYRDDWHDKNDKRIMGSTFSFDANNPLKDMQDVLDMLAEHPATAEFLAEKLCKRFIGDNPPQTIIDQVKNSLHQNWQAPDQIKLAMEILLKSNEFSNTWAEKIKRPFERAASAMRQAGFTYNFDPTDSTSSMLFWAFSNSGQNLFFWTAPNGYPDTKSAWSGASSTMATWRFVQLVTRLRDSNDLPFNSIVNQTLAQFPNANDRTANNMVNYWFERACGFPASGLVQDKLAEFMSYDDTSNPQAGNRDIAIDITSNEWPGYNEERLYAMVTMVFLTAEFNDR